MTIFWIICVVLVLLALLFVLLPLWRGATRHNDVLRDAANLDVLRDQSAELDADLKNGLLTSEAYEQAQRELQSRLLQEVKGEDTAAVAPQRHPAKVLAVVLAVILPLLAVPLYMVLGNTKAMMPQEEESAVAAGFGVIRSEAALQELEKKMERLPENPDGWLLLARSYSELQRFPEAIRAYQNLVKLVPNEAQLWTDYADVSAMNNGQSLLGEPTKYLDKALQLDGNNTSALALSGSAAMERGDYFAAAQHWQKLIALLPADYPDLQMIQGGVDQAREFLAKQKGGKEKLAQLDAGKRVEKQPPVDMSNAISGSVTLSPALSAQVAPTDTVFILARAAEGPKMPLAVLRKQVKDLPLEFTLDDSMAMQPQLKLSGFDQVIVVARVAKSGGPVAQPGDLQGTTSRPVHPGNKEVRIVIDNVVK